MFMNFVESNITESNTLQIVGETVVYLEIEKRGCL